MGHQKNLKVVIIKVLLNLLKNKSKVFYKVIVKDMDLLFLLISLKILGILRKEMFLCLKGI